MSFLVVKVTQSILQEIKIYFGNIVMILSVSGNSTLLTQLRKRTIEQKNNPPTQPNLLTHQPTPLLYLSLTHSQSVSQTNKQSSELTSSRAQQQCTFLFYRGIILLKPRLLRSDFQNFTRHISLKLFYSLHVYNVHVLHLTNYFSFTN